MKRLHRFLALFVFIFMALAFAGCETQEVTLTFNTMGGQPIAAYKVEQNHVFGDQLPIPTRPGHTFLGWYEDNDFEQEFDPFEPMLRHMTIYAKWVINEYTITFETGTEEPIPPIIDEYNTQHGNLNLLFEPTREGHDFLGWYTSDAFETPYTSLRIPAQNMTLFAKWEPHVYTVTFYNQDETVYQTRTIEHGQAVINVPSVPEIEGMTGTWDVADLTNITENIDVNPVYDWIYYEVVIKDEWDTVHDTQSVRHGEAASSMTEDPDVPGYTFTYPPGFDNPVTGPTTFTLDSHRIVVVVEFFDDLGSWLGTDSVYWGDAATAPDLTVRLGYMFIEWDTDFSAVTEALQVHPIVEPIDYDIVFEAGDGEFASEETTLTLTAPFDTLIHAHTDYEAPTRFGYTFLGWYDNDEFTGDPFDIFADTVPLGGTTLYAKWQAKTFTITYDAAGGSVTPATKPVTFDQLIGTLATPSKPGHDFATWMYNDAQITAADVYDFDESITIVAAWNIHTFVITYVVDGVTHETLTVDWGTVLIADDIPDIPAKTHFEDTPPQWSIDLVDVTIDQAYTVHAEYTPNDYEITFDAKGGTPVPDPLVAPYQSAISPPTAPTFDGYSFAGWYTEETYDTPFVFSTMPGGDLTLYARWTEWPVITLDLNGGSGTTSISEEPGTSISAPADPERPGYIFVAWFADTDFTTPYVFDTMPSEDITVYAKWETGTANYTIQYFLQNVHGVYPSTPTSTETLSGDTESMVSVTPDPADGFLFDDTETNVLSGEVAGDGSLILKVYYARDFFEVTLNYEDAVTQAALQDPLRFGALMSFLETAPEREGYIFQGWIDAFGNPYDHNSSMPATNLELYAQWALMTFTIEGDYKFHQYEIVPLSWQDLLALGADSIASDYFTNFEAWDLTDYMTGSVAGRSWYFSDTRIVATSNPEDYGNDDKTVRMRDYIQTEFGTRHFAKITFYATSAGFAGDAGNELTVEVSKDGSTWVTIKAAFAIADQDLTQYEAAIDYTDVAIVAAGITWTDTLYVRISKVDSDTKNVNIDDVRIYNYYEIYQHHDELGDLIADAIRTDLPFTLTNVPWGGSYSLSQTFTGFVLEKIVYDGDTYDSEAEFFAAFGTAAADMEGIELHYVRIIREIEFVQVLRASEEELVDPTVRRNVFIHYVNYGSNFTNIPSLDENYVGSDEFGVVWSRTVFNNVRSNFTPRVIYYQSGYDSVIFVNKGSVILVSSNISEVPETRIIQTTWKHWTLSQPGERFLGWFTVNQTEYDADPSAHTPLDINDMIFGNFDWSEESTHTVYALWKTLDPFAKPTHVAVEYDPVEGVYNIKWRVNPAKIDDVLPAGFNFSLSGVVVYVDMIDITVDGTDFTLELDPEEALYDSFSAIFGPGNHTIEIRAVGDNINHITGAYSDTYVFNVDAVIEGEVLETAVYDYFIVETIEVSGYETRRYVFYSDMTYNFSSRYEFVIISGHEHISASDNTLSTVGKIPGNFRFTITDNIDPENPVTYLYEGRVVYNLGLLGLGDLMTYVEESTGDDYLAPDADDYEVGRRNNFYFNLEIRDNSFVRIPIDMPLLTYTFYLDDAVEPLTEEELGTYVAFTGNNLMQFTADAVGHSFRVEIKQRYQAHQMTHPTLEFSITVNDGHNVFTNLELQDLFQNEDVSILNIHANIKAALKPSQMNADLSPRNLGEGSWNPNNIDTIGNVYARYLNNTTGEEFVINGNYMTIDGGDLPFSNKDSGSGILGYSAAFEVVNVQVSIFMYKVIPPSAMWPTWVNLPTMTNYTYPSQTGWVNDNHFVVNNLTVLSNTSTPAIDYGMSAEDIKLAEDDMSENSGGYNIFMVRDGNSTFNNVRTGYALLPFFTTAWGSQSDTTPIPVTMTVNYAYVYDSWANSFYSHGASHLEITNSWVKQSGGPSIHLVDTKRAGGVFNPSVSIDADTVFDNWISGEEAWFKAYAMTSVALGMKGDIDTELTPLGKTVIQVRTNPVTDLESEMMNIILLTEASSGASLSDSEDARYRGPEYGIMLQDDTSPSPWVLAPTAYDPFDIMTQPVGRPWWFMNAAQANHLYGGALLDHPMIPDPRIVDGLFGFAVGALSESNAFGAAVQHLMIEYEMNAAQAGQVAYIAGFYNLTPDQAALVAGTADGHGVPLPVAVDMVMGTGHPRPRYMEVQALIPLFDDPSVLIVEVFDIED